MTPDLWADYNQIDDDGYVLAYLEDVVRAKGPSESAVTVLARQEVAGEHRRSLAHAG